MSLLNDALKRASKSQQGHDTVRITLPPAEPSPKPCATPGSALSVLVMLLIVATGLSVAAALLFFGMRGKTLPQVTTTTTTTTPTTATLPPLARVVPPAAPKPVPPSATPRNATVAAPAPRPMPAPEPASLPAPTLKLQGITYYNAQWQAIVNGATVYVGDSVNGFRVAQISQNHVSFIAPDGSRRLVPLGQ